MPVALLRFIEAKFPRPRRRAAEPAGLGDNEENSRLGPSEAERLAWASSPRCPQALDQRGGRFPLVGRFTWPRCSQVPPPSTTAFLSLRGLELLGAQTKFSGSLQKQSLVVEGGGTCEQRGLENLPASGNLPPRWSRGWGQRGELPAELVALRRPRHGVLLVVPTPGRFCRPGMAERARPFVQPRKDLTNSLAMLDLPYQDVAPNHPRLPHLGRSSQGRGPQASRRQSRGAAHAPAQGRRPGSAFALDDARRRRSQPSIPAVHQRMRAASARQGALRLPPVHYAASRITFTSSLNRNKRALSSGDARGLAIPIAMRLNHLLGRKGRVFTERYHAVPLGSPRRVRRALAYVLLQERRHAAGRQRALTTTLDRCSSAPGFDDQTVARGGPGAKRSSKPGRGSSPRAGVDTARSILERSRAHAPESSGSLAEAAVSPRPTRAGRRARSN